MDTARSMGVIDTFVYLLKKKERRYPYRETVTYVYVDRRRAWINCDRLNEMNDPEFQYSIQPMSVH